MVRRFLAPALVLAIVAVAGAARAADDPTGTWKFDMKQANNQSRPMTLKLKLDGDKLTGAIVRRNGESAIENATFKDGDIAFTTVRDMGGTKTTTKYTGKLSGDSIKGKIETDRNGETRTQDWDAKREKA